MDTAQIDNNIESKENGKIQESLLESSIQIQKTSEKTLDETQKTKKIISESAKENTESQKIIKEAAVETTKSIKQEAVKEEKRTQEAKEEKKKIEKRIYVEMTEEEKKQQELLDALNDIVTSNEDAEEAQYKIQEHLVTTQKELLKQAKIDKADNTEYYKKSSLFFKEGREAAKAKFKAKVTSAGMGLLGKGLNAVRMKSMGKYFSQQSEVIKDKLNDEQKNQKEGLDKFNNPEKAAEAFNETLEKFSEGVVHNFTKKDGKTTELFAQDGKGDIGDKGREKQSMVYDAVGNSESIKDIFTKQLNNFNPEKDDRGNNKAELKENQDKKDELKEQRKIDKVSKKDQISRLDSLGKNIEAGTAESKKIAKGIGKLGGMMGTALLPVLAVVATALGAWVIGTAIFENFIKGPLGDFLERDRKEKEKAANDGTKLAHLDVSNAAKKLGVDDKEIKKKRAAGEKLSANEKKFLKIKDDRLARENALTAAGITFGSKEYDAMLKMNDADFSKALKTNAVSDGIFGEKGADEKGSDAVKQYEQQTKSLNKKRKRDYEKAELKEKINAQGEVKNRTSVAEDTKGIKKQTQPSESADLKNKEVQNSSLKTQKETNKLLKQIADKKQVSVNTHIPNNKEAPITMVGG